MVPYVFRLAVALLCLAFTMASVACVLPQDDIVLPELPRKRNSPPRILLNTVTPQVKATLDLGINCKRIGFSVNVEDPDVGDLIRNRWFVDPNEQHTTQGFDGTELRGATTAVRTNAAAPPSDIYSGTLANEGTHVVEVVISDGELSQGATPRPNSIQGPLADGGFGPVEDITYIDTYSWFITTRSMPCAL